MSAEYRAGFEIIVARGRVRLSIPEAEVLRDVLEYLTKHPLSHDVSTVHAYGNVIVRRVTSDELAQH